MLIPITASFKRILPARQINHQFNQVEGLAAGYSTQNGTKMTVYDMLMLSSWYDLGGKSNEKLSDPMINHYECADILRGISASLTLDDAHLLTVESHCSSIVRVSPDLSALYSGHTTWAQYGSMLRILKSYDFKIPHACAQTISFSSYPGILSSTDDFFITNTYVNVQLEAKKQCIDYYQWLLCHGDNQLCLEPGIVQDIHQPTHIDELDTCHGSQQKVLNNRIALHWVLIFLQGKGWQALG